MTGIACALGIGFTFGWSLQKAGLTRYDRIVGVYRLRDMTVVTFLLSALAVAAVLLHLMTDVGLAGALPLPPTFVLADLCGGLLFGVGMATSGYCTGTVVAQVGEGRLDALLGGVPGLVAGAVLFGWLQPHLMPMLTRFAALGRVTLPDLLGASQWLVLTVLAELIGVAFLGVRAAARRP